MFIRNAEVLDAQQIQNLVASLSSSFLDSQTDCLPLWYLDSIRLVEFESRLKLEGFTNLVYLEQGKVVGYIAIKDNQYIYHLFVANACQGRGIARKLWERVLSELDSETYSVKSSLNAIPVYSSFGFERDGDIASKDRLFVQPMTWIADKSDHV